MLTKSRFICSATSGFENDSRSMTWLHYNDKAPTERKIGLSSRRAFSIASSLQGYQSTGLCWCNRRYGLLSPARRLVRLVSCDVLIGFPPRPWRCGSRAAWRVIVSGPHLPGVLPASLPRAFGPALITPALFSQPPPLP